MPAVRGPQLEGRPGQGQPHARRAEVRHASPSSRAAPRHACRARRSPPTMVSRTGIAGRSVERQRERIALEHGEVGAPPRGEPPALALGVGDPRRRPP